MIDIVPDLCYDSMVVRFRDLRTRSEFIRDCRTE
jgi:hypothetical protein